MLKREELDGGQQRRQVVTGQQPHLHAGPSVGKVSRNEIGVEVGINQWMRGELAPATVSATSLLRKAKANQDLSARIVALRMCGSCELYAGDFAAACQYFDELVRLYEPTRHRECCGPR